MNPLTGPESFLGVVAGHLQGCGIGFMLTGSFVSTFYGDPRTTRDLDVVVDAVEPPDTTIRRFVDRCESSGLYVSRDAAFEPTRSARRQFNVISGSTGWKADIMWVLDRPFSRVEFSRRREIELLGQKIFVPSPEDIVLAKLEWGATAESRQFDDAVSVLRVQGHRLDPTYLARWATDLGISDLLNRALSAAAGQ